MSQGRYFYVIYGTEAQRKASKPLIARDEEYTRYVEDARYYADRVMGQSSTHHIVSGVMWEESLPTSARKIVDGAQLFALGWSYRPSSDGRDPVAAVFREVDT
jgi:hypothetical protein